MLTPNSLKSILTSHTAGWCERRFDDGRACSWLKVLEVRSKALTEHSYGILRSGEWVAEFADRLRVMPIAHYVPFFPLLELSHELAVNELKQGVVQVNLPLVVYTTFPFDSILESALRHGGYWEECGRAWLDSGYPINGAIADAVPDHPFVQRWNMNRFRSVYLIDPATSE